MRAVTFSAGSVNSSPAWLASTRQLPCFNSVKVLVETLHISGEIEL